MATTTKRLGKAKEKKKGFDQRDGIVVFCYVLVFGFIIFLFILSQQGNKKVKELEDRLTEVTNKSSQAKKIVGGSEKEIGSWRAKMTDSETKLGREKTEYDFVVGTSLEYAQKNKLMMAIWETIDKIRNVALRRLSINKNEVNIELITPSGVYLTDFMGTLYKRTDLIETIQVTETKPEKGGDKKGDKDIIVGQVKIIAKAK